jgi:hypothetical protein
MPLPGLVLPILDDLQLIDGMLHGFPGLVLVAMEIVGSVVEFLPGVPKGFEGVMNARIVLVFIG